MENNRLAINTNSISTLLPDVSHKVILNSARIGLIAFSLSLVSACSTFNNMAALNSGADDALTSQDIAAYAAKQDEVYQSLLRLAGLPDQPATTEEWNQFIMAGVQYANQKCESYLDAVNWAKQGSQRDSNLIGQTGAFTSSVLGIAKASARELAFTAAAFGYTQAGFNTFNADMLAGLEPSSTRNLVHSLQQQYVEQVNANQYTNRVGAFNALQGYIRLCLPGNIAAEANNAVRGAKPLNKAMSGSINQAPYISVDANSNASNALPLDNSLPPANTMNTFPNDPMTPAVP